MYIEHTEFFASTSIAYYIMIISLIHSPTSVLIEPICFILFEQSLSYNISITDTYVSVNYYLAKLSSPQLNNGEFLFGYIKLMMVLLANLLYHIHFQCEDNISNYLKYVKMYTLKKIYDLMLLFRYFIPLSQKINYNISLT